MDNFKIYGVPSLLYSLLFTVCLYKNCTGLMFTLFCTGTVIYMYFVIKKTGKQYSLFNYGLSAAIVLVGVSNLISANVEIMMLNYLMLLALIMINTVYAMVPADKLNIITSITVFIRAGVGMFESIAVPFASLSNIVKTKRKEKNKTVAYAIIGIVVALPVLIIVMAMLSMADQVFGQLTEKIFGTIFSSNIFANIIGVCIYLVIGFSVPFAYIYDIEKSKDKYEGNIRKNGEPIIAIIVLSAISVVYAVFDAIQIAFLFMHKGSLPKGYTYAEYARQGFFELIFVAILNIVIVIVAMELFKKSKLMYGLLEFVSGCTIIIAISAVYRLFLYIDVYGLTFTRVFAMWTLFVVCLLIAGLMLKVVMTDINIFKYFTIVIVSCYLVLALSNSEYYIAKYDLNKYKTIEQIQDKAEYDEYDMIVDYEYLMGLSTDAVPAMKEAGLDIKEALDNEEVYKFWQTQCNQKTTIRGFNISKYRAKTIVDSYK